MVIKLGKCGLAQTVLLILLSPGIGLPSSIVILDKNGRELSDVVGPLDEGSQLSLVCQTNGGIPSIVTWWRGSSLLDDSFISMPHGVTRNELFLSRLHRDDLMTSFKCQARAPNITQPTETSISVDLNLRPVDVHITSLQRPLSAGREVNLKCQSTGSRPPAVITWWKGSQQLLSTKNSSSNGISYSILLFTPAMEDHGKVLSCRASNPVMDGYILEDHRILNIYYVPQLAVIVGAPRANIQEGDDVYFECNIQANPSITEVAWRFNGKSVYTNLLGGVKVNNQSLLLRHVTRQNTGNYTCVAANVEGEGLSQSVYLDVLYIPYCAPDQQFSYGVPIKETARVHCRVISNPESVVFQWYLNSTITQRPIKTFIVNGTESTAFYTPKKKKDYGYLMCRAQNIVGMQKEPCCFKINPASLPETPQNCEVSNETSSSVLVACEPGDSGGLEQHFHIELYSTQGLHAVLNDLEIPIFHVTGLPSGISYIAVVYATNSQGRSNSVALTARTKPYPGPRPDARAMLVSPVLAVLIIVISILVLAAIVIVIGMKNRELYSDEGDEGNPGNPYSWEQPPMPIAEIKPAQQQYI